ncbi:alpha/beta fold hydrolase [Alkaliphilus crotonatoxidans]
MNRPENKTIIVNSQELDYIVFGRGDTPLIILPGINDSLRPVQRQAVSLSWQYDQFTEDFTVYIFSRSKNLAPSSSIREMAQTQGLALKTLGLTRAAVLGSSMGGMLAQYLAIDFPEQVASLALAVTTANVTEKMKAILNHWVSLAEANEGDHLVTEILEKTFTPAKINEYKPLYPMIKKINRPNSYQSFIIQARACMNHQALSELPKISQPTLILGGTEDQIVGQRAAEEMAALIPKSQLALFEGYGHGAQEETKEFNQRLFRFLVEWK